MHKGKFKKLLLIMTCVFFVNPSIVLAMKTSQCYAVGYAYSYEFNKYYYSNLATYKTLGDGCLTPSTHAENEWNDYFKSEKKKYYEYTKGVYNSCACNGKHGKAKKNIKERRNKWKGKYRSKDFRIRKLDEFDPSNSYD